MPFRVMLVYQDGDVGIVLLGLRSCDEFEERAECRSSEPVQQRCVWARPGGDVGKDL